MWGNRKKSTQLDIANGLYFYKNNNNCNRNYIQGNIKLKTSVEILFWIIQTSDKLYPRLQPQNLSHDSTFPLSLMIQMEMETK